MDVFGLPGCHWIEGECRSYSVCQSEAPANVDEQTAAPGDCPG